jgi:hypothetical protein
MKANTPNKTYKVLESVSSQMKMSHESEEPDDWVRASQSETNPDTGVSLLLNSIGSNTAVGEDSFLGSKPSSGQRCVWKAEEANNGNDEGNSSLEDKKPLPTGQTRRTIHSMEYASSDQSCEGCSKDIARTNEVTVSMLLHKYGKGTEKKSRKTIWWL